MHQPYIDVLVAQLGRQDVHSAVIRNSLRILQNVVIPVEFHGEIMQACFAYIENYETPAAAKAFSLTILDNLSKLYPEIRQELTLIIKEHWQVETPAFKSRAKKIIGKQKDF